MCEFELPDVTLRFFVATQLLSRIYALSSVKFSGLKLWLCKKCDKYEVCTKLVITKLVSFLNCFLNFPFLSQLDESSKRRRIKLEEVMDNDHGKNYLNRERISHKCNQCEYTSFRRGSLRGHLKTQSGEKLNK